MGRSAFVLVLGLTSCAPVPADGRTEPDRGGPVAESTTENHRSIETERTSEEGAPVPASKNNLFGHFAFEETDAPLGNAGQYRDTGRVVQLRVEATETFRAMQEAARRGGVQLTPISGFRTLSYQNGLFSRAIRKYGSPESAARWVAPPGYSEHHTGLALDIGDLDRPETDVETTFEDTPAFLWLKDNAHRFGFEISFPKDNPQGVSYEPWHWRYTGASGTP